PANETLESRNARLILGQHIGGRRVAVEPTGLGLGDPDLNQIAADPVAPGEGVQWLPTQKFLDDLALELDRMRAVLGHGLSPRKPGSVSRFSPSPSVHPKGCTPYCLSESPATGEPTKPLGCPSGLRHAIRRSQTSCTLLFHQLANPPRLLQTDDIR